MTRRHFSSTKTRFSPAVRELPTGSAMARSAATFGFASSLEPAAMVPTVVEIYQIFFVARSTRLPQHSIRCCAGGLTFGSGSQQALGTWEAEC